MWAFGVIVNMFELRLASQQTHQHFESVASSIGNSRRDTFSTSGSLKLVSESSKPDFVTEDLLMDKFPKQDLLKNIFSDLSEANGESCMTDPDMD